jgi:hypothetical protein
MAGQAPAVPPLAAGGATFLIEWLASSQWMHDQLQGSDRWSRLLLASNYFFGIGHHVRWAGAFGLLVAVLTYAGLKGLKGLTAFLGGVGVTVIASAIVSELAIEVVRGGDAKGYQIVSTLGMSPHTVLLSVIVGIVLVGLPEGKKK